MNGLHAAELGNFALVLLVCALGVQTMFQVLPNTDLGWVIHVGERLANGGRLYVDAIDVHPPLLFWYSALGAWMSTNLGIDPINGYRLLVMTHVLLALFLVRNISRSWTATAASAIALFTTVGANYGEGEHFFAAAFLPYLVLIRARCEGKPIGAWASVLTGLLMGLGISRKPYLGFAWLFLEAFMFKRGKWRRPELLAVLATGCTYVLAVVVLAPEYFRVMRWAVDGYSGFYPADVRMLLATRTTALTAGLIVVLFFSDRGNITALGSAILLVGAVLWQGHGWGYHWYPALAVAIYAIGAKVLRRKWVPVLAAPLILLFSYWTQFVYRDLSLWPYMLHKTRPIVAEYGGPVMAFSTLMQATFPLVNVERTAIASRYPTLWPVTAAYKEQGDPYPYHSPAAMPDIERAMWESVIDDFVHTRPRVLLVDTFPPRPRPYANPMDGWRWLDYFGRDHRFAQAFRRYEELAPIANYRVFVRVYDGI